MNASPAPTVSTTSTAGEATSARARRALCQRAVGAPREHSQPDAAREDPVEDGLGRLARVEPRRVRVAQLDHVGEPRPALEAAPVVVPVAEHRGADVRVDHDQPPPRLPLEQGLDRAGGRIRRERERARAQRENVGPELGQVAGGEVRVGRPLEVEHELVAAVLRLLDDGEGGRRGPVQDVAEVDAALGEPGLEQAPEAVVGEAPEEADRDLEAAEGDGRVERAAAGQRPQRPVLLDQVDQSLAHGDDHGTHLDRGKERGSYSGDGNDNAVFLTKWPIRRHFCSRPEGSRSTSGASSHSATGTSVSGPARSTRSSATTAPASRP